MEKFFAQQPTALPTTSSGGVCLHASHLILPADIAEKILEGKFNVLVGFDEKTQTITLAPEDDGLFQLKYKAELVMVKSRSLSGEKAIALHNWTVTYDLNEDDRPLNYTVTTENDTNNYLTVQL